MCDTATIHAQADTDAGKAPRWLAIEDGRIAMRSDANVLSILSQREALVFFMNTAVSHLAAGDRSSPEQAAALLQFGEAIREARRLKRSRSTKAGAALDSNAPASTSKGLDQ